MDVLDHLEQTFAMTASIVQGIGADQLALPTPCDDWDVARLLAHTIGVLDAFARREPDPTAAAALRPDIAGQFDASASAALAAWRAPRGLDGVHARPGRPPLPWAVFARINLVDTYGHGWDLAQATGQNTRIDDDLARACLDAARQVVSDEARPIVGFKPAGTIDPTAPASHQLAAFLGRTVP